MTTTTTNSANSVELTSATMALLRERWCAAHGPESDVTLQGEFDAGFVEFVDQIMALCTRYNCGLTPGKLAKAKDRQAFVATLRLDELLLARDCAEGKPEAWERFLTLYRETLYGAAYAMTRSDAAGRELADSLYADLFGLREKDGARLSPLAHYHGRGSLAGWLKSVLAQRFVDGYRKTRREVAVEEEQEFVDERTTNATALPVEKNFRLLTENLQSELKSLKAEERFLLSSYFIDGRTLKQIAIVLGVHESTISRNLTRLGQELRKRIAKRMRKFGLSAAEIAELFETDVREIDLPIKKILQATPQSAFPIKGEQQLGSVSTTQAATKGGDGDD